MLETFKELITNVDFLGAIFSTLLLISLGYILKRKNLISLEGKKQITSLLLILFLPISAFNAFLSDFSLSSLIDNSLIIFYTLICYFFCLFFGLLVNRNSSKEKRVAYTTTLMLGQVTFVCLPIILSIYTSKEVITCNFITIIFRLFLYLVAFGMISGVNSSNLDFKQVSKKFLLNPIMIATLLGLVIWISQDLVLINGVKILRIDHSLPIIYKPIKMLNSVTSPLAMLLVGISIGDIKFSQAIKNRNAWLYSISRCLVAPIICLLIGYLLTRFSFFQVSKSSFIVAILCFSGPVSVVLSTYCNKYKVDELAVSESCLLSSFISIITIPLFISLATFIINL